MPVMHQAVKAYLANQRLGHRVHQDARLRHRWKPEAVEAEGNRPRPSGLDPRSAFGRRWYGVRSDWPRSTAQTCRARSAHLPARARSTPALRENALIVIDNFDYDAPSTKPIGLAARRTRRDRTEGSDSHRRREAERVPERAQSAAHAGDAVLRRLDVPPPLVGCRARRVQRAWLQARAQSKRRQRAARPKSARQVARRREGRAQDGEGCNEELQRAQDSAKGRQGRRQVGQAARPPRA